jgi:hypothetical protein
MILIIDRGEWVSYSHWGMFPLRRKVRVTRRQSATRRKAH